MRGYKNHILAWLPVMIEMERMGADPVKELFAPGPMNTELAYRAMTVVKKEHPEWYAVMSDYAQI